MVWEDKIICFWDLLTCNCIFIVVSNFFQILLLFNDLVCYWPHGNFWKWVFFFLLDSIDFSRGSASFFISLPSYILYEVGCFSGRNSGRNSSEIPCEFWCRLLLWKAGKTGWKRTDGILLLFVFFNFSDRNSSIYISDICGFHLHLLVFPFVYQFNSKIGVLVLSSFAND